MKCTQNKLSLNVFIIVNKYKSLQTKNKTKII